MEATLSLVETFTGPHQSENIREAHSSRNTGFATRDHQHAFHQFPLPTFFKSLDVPHREQKLVPPTEGPEGRPPYLDHEWPEEAGWAAKVAHNFLAVLNNSTFRCQYTSADLMSLPIKYTTEEAQRFERSLPEQRDAELILDKEGKLLGAFLPDAIDWIWSTDRANALAKIPVQATMDLVDAYPPPMPKVDDIRHVNPVEERRRLDQIG